MALIIRQPTTNQSPDPGQGGLAVSTPINTGHALSSCLDTVPASPVVKTCIWAGFDAASPIAAIQLKFDWAYQNAVSDAGGDGNINQFIVEYSVNSGGAWSSALSRTNVNGSSSSSVNQNIPTQQDITTIQVRDKITATAGSTQTGRIDASISNIQLEVTTFEGGNVIVMM